MARREAETTMAKPDLRAGSGAGRTGSHSVRCVHVQDRADQDRFVCGLPREASNSSRLEGDSMFSMCRRRRRSSQEAITNQGSRRIVSRMWQNVLDDAIDGATILLGRLLQCGETTRTSREGETGLCANYREQREASREDSARAMRRLRLCSCRDAS